MFVCGNRIAGARFSLAMPDWPHLWVGMMRCHESRQACARSRVPAVAGLAWI